MTVTESTDLLVLWQPAVEAIVSQLSDFFGARLGLSEALVEEGAWKQLSKQLPASAVLVPLQLSGDYQGEIYAVWAGSDETGEADWTASDEVQSGVWEAIGGGLAVALGEGVGVELRGEPWAVAATDEDFTLGAAETLLAWEASGDGIALFLGFLVSPLQKAQPEPAKVAMRPPRLESVKSSNPEGHQIGHDLDMIMDLPLQLTVEIGSTRLLIKDVLALGKGSVVELNRLAGDPIDVLINGKQLAKGEIVVLPDGNFGVRMVEISGSQERLRSLKAE